MVPNGMPTGTTMGGWTGRKRPGRAAIRGPRHAGDVSRGVVSVNPPYRWNDKPTGLSRLEGDAS
jgi:hypothetical protein